MKISPANVRVIDRVLDVLEREGVPEHALDRAEQRLREAAETIGEADQTIELPEIPCRVKLIGKGPARAPSAARRAMARLLAKD